jgi:sugar O-acyltransferase (sialic acid O-acetyltransferase NeuD family)
MFEPLIIVGAGGHGRETALAHLQSEHAQSFVGFLDDVITGATPEGWPILGTVDDARVHLRASFVVAINDPRVRRDIARRLGRLGVSRWGTVMHPDVRMHSSVKLGVGCSLLGGCLLTTNIRIGDHCILNRQCQVGHDCVVGDYCSLNPGAILGGAVQIGTGCELGSGAMVRQGIAVGSGSTIGMGSVVVKNVPPGAVFAGVPARLMRRETTW